MYSGEVIETLIVCFVHFLQLQGDTPATDPKALYHLMQHEANRNRQLQTKLKQLHHGLKLVQKENMKIVSLMCHSSSSSSV